MSPNAMWTFHVVVNLPGWLAVRSPVSQRAGTFGACLRERGSTGTGNHHACKILSLVAHMAGPSRALWRWWKEALPFDTQSGKKTYTFQKNTLTHTLTRKQKHAHISTSQNLLWVALSLFLTHTYLKRWETCSTYCSDWSSVAYCNHYL